LSDSELTAKEARFVEEWPVDFNGRQAAIRAGYSAKSATEIAYENLRKPHIQQAIRQKLKERSRNAEITKQMLVQELRLIAFADKRDFFRVTESGTLVLDMDIDDPLLLRSIAEVTQEDFPDGKGEDAQRVRRTKLKMYDKIRAIELIAKLEGHYSDKLELSGEVKTSGFTDDQRAAIVAAIIERRGKTAP
jgi:phage terminase small subunit